MVKNLYFTLGVQHDATSRQIDVMYEAAIHDLEAGGYTKVPIVAAQQAYSVLGHPARRLAYDKSLGASVADEYPQKAVWVNPAPDPAPPPGELNAVSLTRSFHTIRPSFEELFDRLWSNFAQLARPKSETVQSLTIEIPITRQQALTGGTAEVMVPALIQCSLCGGSGGVGPFRCASCDGRGAVADEYPVQVSFPAGYASYTTQVPLTQLGIHNFYLTVNFRVTGVPRP
jgi:DnaJ-class molecular chaperone